MTPTRTMREVIEVLGDVYRDDGIAIWLAGEHRSGPFKGRRPVDVCKTAAGRAEVWDVADGLAGGNFG